MMRLRRPYRALAAMLGAALIGLLLAVLSLSEPQPVLETRNIIFDSYQRARPRPFDPAMPVRIIDIDDESLEKFGQWPWPRTILARLIDEIGQRAPLVIALDILLSEPDRTSPDQLLKLFPASAERDALEERLKKQSFSNDALLADSLAKVPVVSGIVMAHGEGTVPIRAGFATAGDNPAPFLPKFTGAVAPIPILQSPLKGFGALNWLPEFDQVVRSIPTLFVAKDRLVPALAIEALRVAQGASTIIVKSSNASGETAFGRQTGVNSLKVGDVVLKTDGDGSLRLRFAGARPERRIPAWRVLEGTLPREELEGRIVFVGTSAAALADLRATPLNPVVPGVEVHAEIIEHALSGGELSRPDWAAGAEAVATLLASVTAGVAAFYLLPFAAAFACVLAIGLLAYGSWALFVHMNLLLDPVLPVVAMTASFFVVSLARWKATDTERKAVRTAFSHYLSPAMVERLAQAPEELKLGGERRTMTILFGDVRGFTSLAETFKGDPQALTALMNRLLNPLSNAIVEHSGTIDKYMGDAIMAFWNAPLDVPDHAAHACRAALDMQQRLDSVNRELEAEAVATGRKHTTIAIGIGLNTGACTVGNMGSDLRFDYSVLGDPVNLASRLEGQSKSYGLSILLGETTAELVRDRLAVLEVDLIRVHGKQQPERVFALLGDETLAQSRRFAELREKLAAILQGCRSRQWVAAMEQIDQWIAGGAEGEIRPLLDVLRRRMAAYHLSPPAADWDGVYDAQSK